MSTLYITEFESMPSGIQGAPQIWQEPGITKQAVSYTGTPGRSAAFGPTTKFIAITSDGTFSYRVASGNPDAVVTDFRIPAGLVICFGVQAAHKISAITNT